MQHALFSEQSKHKTLRQIPVDCLTISPFNPRRTRNEFDVQRLAERIERNGFEITRALWVYPNNGHYEVFAGGNRLEAVKRTSIAEVPAIVHEGYDDDEITRLADVDNENDEYHAHVPIVDVWMDYKRLHEMGWTQQRIARAKGVSQGRASERIRWAQLPSSLLKIIQGNHLQETHAREIDELFKLNNLSSWLSFETAALEVIDKALAKGGTAKHFADVVQTYNGFISLAQDYANALEGQWQKQFVDELAQSNARSKAAVESAHSRIINRQVHEAALREEELARQRDEAEAEKLRLQREAALIAQTQATLARLVLGDSREAINDAPTNIKLLLTDPPYGQNFQSNRRVVSAKADRLQNDDQNAFSLLHDVLSAAHERMAENSHCLIWTSWRHEPRFRSVIQQCGFEIRGSLIWNKPNHGSGDLEGAFAPKHERIIHAVKGNPKLNQRPDDVLSGSDFLNTGHPTEKPLELLSRLIEACTDEGDIVADPFMGGGSTIIAAYKAQRDFWACEIEPEWHEAASSKLYDMLVDGEPK